MSISLRYIKSVEIKNWLVVVSTKEKSLGLHDVRIAGSLKPRSLKLFPTDILHGIIF